MHLFYTPDIVENDYTLPEEESKHAVKVLRLEVGDPIVAVDGKGNWFRCLIEQADARRCRVRCEEKIANYGRRPYRLHIAIAPTKNIERFEWFLEKCTEIGIEEITPLLCDHSERKVIKHERLEKVIVAAMKQSLKASLPVLHPLTPFDAFVQRADGAFKGIAHCEEGDKKRLNDVYRPGQDAVFLIGPEGDFSPQEIQLALANQFLPLTLGESRLRTETAGIVVCHGVHFMNRV